MTRHDIPPLVGRRDSSHDTHESGRKALVCAILGVKGYLVLDVGSRDAWMRRLQRIAGELRGPLDVNTAACTRENMQPSFSHC